MDMKRRKRKRSSKSARPAKIPVDAKTAAGPSTALAGADYVIDLGDEFLATVEQEKPASDSVTLAEADDHTHSGDEFMAAVEEEKPAGPSAAPAGADRRTHPRYGPIAFSGCPRGRMVNQETGGARNTLSA